MWMGVLIKISVVIGLDNSLWGSGLTATKSICKSAHFYTPVGFQQIYVIGCGTDHQANFPTGADEFGHRHSEANYLDCSTPVRIKWSPASPGILLGIGNGISVDRAWIWDILFCHRLGAHRRQKRDKEEPPLPRQNPHEEVYHRRNLTKLQTHRTSISQPHVYIYIYMKPC